MQWERRNQIDKERRSHANQRIDDAVEGKFSDADIPAMRNGDTEESDTGDVGQSAFLQEVNEDPGARKQVGFIPANWYPDLADDVRNIHQWNDAEGNQRITQDWAAQDVIVMRQVEDTHAGEPTEQCADCAVQSNTDGTFDF